MKLKLVSIMTAASFQDWKKLAARDGGDDEFVEGDLLRVTGNIAGNSVSYILKKAGMGLGQGISSVTHALGDGIENATDAIGARAVGAGVNSLVSGVGDGVGGALSGGEYSFALRGELCRMDYAANDAFSFFSG
jgi:vacuolar protein sorting-associated protein 13A/C